MKRCKQCRADISTKRPQAKYCGQACKDAYWNTVKPVRGRLKPNMATVGLEIARQLERIADALSAPPNREVIQGEVGRESGSVSEAKSDD